MNLERFIAALGPGEVVERRRRGEPASVEISDLAYDTRAVASGRALLLRARAGTPTVTRSHRRRPRSAPPRSSSSIRSASTSRSSSWRTSGRRCRSPARLFFARPVPRPRGRRRHRHERQDDDRVPAPVDPRGGRTADRACSRTSSGASGASRGRPGSTRRRRSTSSGCSARWSTPATARACSRRPRRRAPRAGSRGRRFAVLVFTNLTPGSPELPRHDGGLLRGEGRAVRPGRPGGRQRRRASGGGDSPASCPTRSPSTHRSDALDGIELRLRGAFNRENAIGAALAAAALGVERDAIKRGIESVAGVPGRFESIDAGQPFTVHRRLRPHAGLARERHLHGARGSATAG